MLSPQNGWQLTSFTWASAVTSDGTMYQATAVQGDGNPGTGAATLVYSSDGIIWTQVDSFPSTIDYVQSLFAVGNTVYVGTGFGYVYSTNDKGITWLPNTPEALDGSTVNAIVVDGSGNYYAGTNNGNVYYSTSSGESWTLVINQPTTGGGSISSLAIDDVGTLYAVTSETTTQPQYNSAPLAAGTWQTMGQLPLNKGNATAIAASGSVVYVGTDTSYVAYTLNKGQSWIANQVPNDISGVASLFVKQHALSPLFVESYGTIPIIGSSSTGTITVTNFGSTTATNVQASLSQLPAGVTSSSCASVPSKGSCLITLTAAIGTKAFAPTAFDVIDSSNNVISRAALVSSITPNNGVDFYFVYAVDGVNAYVIDSTDVSPSIVWSTNSSGGSSLTPIWGIAENSTSLAPYPNGTSGATKYLTQSNCFGATDGLCNSANILVYYNSIIAGSPIDLNSYATGLCYQSQAGGANQGDWYLPSICDLHGGIYLNRETNSFSSCSPMLTSAFSLHGLGALGGVLQELMFSSLWSSTETSITPYLSVWRHNFFPSGGGTLEGIRKDFDNSARCVRTLPL